VFETSIGMAPMQRWTNLEEGNTCMSCHGKSSYDYSRFKGGAECKEAFEPEVGSVEDCTTCHRVAGTPLQWPHAKKGNLAGKACVNCHMPLVTRPVAVGQPPTRVHSHVFPASRSESQLQRAYGYDAHVEGNEVVVRITNRGVGHGIANKAVCGQREVVIPTGASAEDMKQLTALFEFHLPEARLRARTRLAELYPDSAEELIAALGRWSNETFNEAKKTFREIGAPGVPALVGAERGTEDVDRLLARAARTRLLLGDEWARDVLGGLLLSPQESAHRIAIGALTEVFGEDRDYAAGAEPDARLEAAQHWL